MEAGRLLCLEGGTTIGIKSRYIEWARLEGRSPSAVEPRVVLKHEDYPVHTQRWCVWCELLGAGSESRGIGVSIAGSTALGLSEQHYETVERSNSECSFLEPATSARRQTVQRAAVGKLEHGESRPRRTR